MRIYAEEIGVGSIEELRQKTPAELKEDLRTLRRLNVDMKFQRIYGQLENERRAGQNRKNIARILTVLREKQIQHFLLNDSDVIHALDGGRVRLSAGKNDPKSTVARNDIAGNDARAVTLAMRLWAQLRKDDAFFGRTRTIREI